MRKLKLISYGIAMTCLAILSSNTVLAADLHVPADYPTIQSAVDAASSGDTIHVAPGVYVEQVTVAEKDLTLIGKQLLSPGNCTVRCGGFRTDPRRRASGR